MENLVEDNGICDCHYLLTMRLALQREVDSPFGINSIYDLGDWCAPWWRKPVSYADLDAFFESTMRVLKSTLDWRLKKSMEPLTKRS